MSDISFFNISAFVISVISLLLSFYAVYVSNKPYLIKLFVMENGYRENFFEFSVANIGRDIVYPKCIRIIDSNTGAIYGQNYFRLEGKSVFSIAPGEIQHVKIYLSSNYPYKHEIDVNPLLEVIIEDMKGKETIYRNIFGVG